MQSSGISSDISKHLSSLRMNTLSRRSSSVSTSPTFNNKQSSPSSSVSNDDTFNDKEFSFNPLDTDSYPLDLLTTGIDMIKITRGKRVRTQFTIKVPEFTICWNSKKRVKEIEIDKIQSIRVGDNARNYREEFNVSEEFGKLWITVIYIKSTKSNLYNDLKALHLVATTKRNYDVFNKYIRFLLKWTKDQESLINCANINEFSINKWNNKIKSSKDKNVDRDRLSFDEVISLTNELHIFMDISYLREYFDECDEDNINTLDFVQFQKFVSKLREKPELKMVFKKLGILDDKMSYEKFHYFIKFIQNETTFDDEKIMTLFDKFSHENNGNFLTPSNLSTFLISSFTKPLVNEEDFFENYYSYPLNNYFISSSHNTYLLGKQIHGMSSIEGYIHALQRGCRCIEIDIWSNENSNPIVTHGHTLTNSIDFELVIDTIHKYAFISTPYPLIISLEIKCNKETQLKCIPIMKNIFGDMLFTELVDNNSVLPSPEQLKHKILIKVKKSTETTIVEPESSNSHSLLSTTTTSSTQSDDFLYDDESSINNGNMKTANISSTTTTITSIKKIVTKNPTKKIIITPELTSLSPYLVGIKFRNFSLPESKTFNHVFSFSDRSLLILMRDKIKLLAILKHNKRGLMRIYPSIVRYKSDNFNPIKFWETGCQMVATNWQIWDSGEEISESLFASIGSNVGYSGYRLKPLLLRNNDDFKNDKDKEKELNKEKIKSLLINSLNFNIEKYLNIDIISGQQLIKPKDLNTSSNGFTPWVEVEFYNIKLINAEISHVNINDKNIPVNSENFDKNIDDDFNRELIVNHNNSNDEEIDLDDNHGKIKINDIDRFYSNAIPDIVFKTRLAEKKNNAFNPIWNISCRLNYFTNENDLSFLRILVKTKKPNKQNVISKVVSSNSDCLIGSWCCKISDLKKGYRYVKLGDNKGKELIYSSLFIRVTK